MVKKQLIMEKALELFANNGFEATSVQQITEKCGISKGAFYLSFKSKDELILSIIDQFMSEIISDVEQAVSEGESHDHLLYDFYYVSFNAFQKHAYFAKLIVKEQIASVNYDLMKKMEIYNNILNKVVFSIVERQFGDLHPNAKADLVFTIQGFSQLYGGLFLFEDLPINIKVLCESLVEKTRIIAEYSTITVLSPEFFSLSHFEDHMPNKEQVIEMLSGKINEMEDKIIHESLILLRKELQEPSLSPAIIQGLLKNLQESSDCKWIAYLYKNVLANRAQ